VSVPCIYPDAINDDGEPAFLPDGYEEFKSSEFCTHLHCAEAADAYAIWRGSRGYTPDEQAALEGDRELMRDEYHV